MATIRSRTLAALISPKFQTGGEVKPGEVGPDIRRPGVADYTSAFQKADQRGVLNVAKVTRKVAIGISPFLAEDPARGSVMTRYAHRCAEDGIRRNEALAMANIAFLTPQSSSAVERDDAFLNLLSWIPRAELIAVYVDYGITPAMEVAINVAIMKSRKIEYRSIGGV